MQIVGKCKTNKISFHLFAGKVKIEKQTNSNHIFQTSISYSTLKLSTENPPIIMLPTVKDTRNKNPCEEQCNRQEKCPLSCLLRKKRSESSIERKGEFKFFDFEERGIESDRETVPEILYTAMPVIQAHGVGGPELGAEGHIFLSANNTVVETHKGTETTLNCRIARDSDYGTVSCSLESKKSFVNGIKYVPTFSSPCLLHIYFTCIMS